MSSSTLLLVQFIQGKLKRTRNRLTRVDLAKGAALTVGTLAATWLVGAGLESVFWFKPLVRSFLLTGILLSTLYATGRYLIWPFLVNTAVISGRSDAVLARMIGRHFPEIGDRLLNVIQLSEGKHSHSPEPFVDLAVQRLAEEMQDVPFEKLRSWRDAYVSGRFAAIPVALISIFLFAAPGSFLPATERIMQPAQAFERGAPFSFRISPGDTELTIGDSLLISVQIQGDIGAETPVIETRVEGELRSRFADLVPDSSGYLFHTYAGVRQSFRYRVSSREVTDKWYSVRVMARPLVQELNVQLTYPAYTRIPPRTLGANVGDIRALTGSVVDLKINIGGARASRATIEFQSGKKSDMILLGQSARAGFAIIKADTYHISLESENSIQNLDPISYRIETLIDAYPSSNLLSPDVLVDLNDELRASLLIHVTDDFGFHDLKLFYRLAESRFGDISETFESFNIPLTHAYQLDQEIPFEWSLTSNTRLDPVPGDIIEYYVEVRDNDSISGFKSAQSSLFRLRLPSLAQQYREIDDSQEQTQFSLEKLLLDAQTIREKFDELKNELLQNPDADWQDERMLDQLQQRQKNLENAVDRISEQMQELAGQMSENDLVSDQTLSLFEQLQQVVEEVRTPELNEALEQLQSALEDMNLNKMWEALEKFEFSEKQFQNRLQRTVDLFKKFRVQQDMEEIENRAEDLAKTEDRLAGETAGLQNEQSDEKESPRESGGENEQSEKRNEELAEQQELAADEMKALEEKMEEVLERMEELKNMPSRQMQDLMEDTGDDQLARQMQENAQELRENNLQEARQQQQELSRQLGQLSAQMNEMQMNMQGAQMQINISAIRTTLEDILTLSQKQEALRHEVMILSSDSPLLRSSAQIQVDLAQGLSVVSDSLQSIAKEIPQMTRDIQQRAGDALREMGDATSALTERAVRRASGHQKGAMTNLNELALMLSELLNQAMNGSGAGQSNQSMEQMMEQLQQMGKDQQKLNQQIQQLLNDLQGKRLSSDMMDRVRQMAAQQEQIRNDLRNMSRDRSLRNKVLGDLNRIAEQMMESILDLQQNRVSRRTVQRQQQILTRLLEASRSMEQRGRDKKREGRSAEEILRESPADLPPQEQMERLRRDLIRALDTGYSTDYEALIRKYFELLQLRTGEGLR